MKITKIFVVALVAMTSTSNLNAQVFEEGNVSIDMYYGFPNLYTTVFKTAYANSGTEQDIQIGGIGPVGLRTEYLLTDKIGLGLDLGFNHQSLEIENTDVIIHAVAGESEPEVVGDGDPVHAIGPHNRADQLVGRRIDYLRLRPMRDIQPVIIAIEVRVIPAVGAADFDLGEYLVSRRRGEGGGRADEQEERFHWWNSLSGISKRPIVQSIL